MKNKTVLQLTKNIKNKTLEIYFYKSSCSSRYNKQLTMTQPLHFLSPKTQIYNVKFSEDHLSKNDIFLIKIICL